MLPDDFQWDDTNQYGQDWLRCGRVIVAGVCQTVILGKWLGRVNRHDERVPDYPSAYFRSRCAAMRSAERWACAHAARLRHEILTGARRKVPTPPASRADKAAQRKLRG